MGLVGETTESYAARVDGYPLEGTAYYLYCDACGSFKIRRHIKTAQWVLLILFTATTAAGWGYFIKSQSFSGNELLGCWIIYVVLVVTVIGLLSPYLPHKCIKCGNTNITDKDVLNYSRHKDLSEVIDVPRAMLHKPDRNLANDVKAIPLGVMVLLCLVLLPVVFPLGLLINSIYSKIKEKN